MAKQIFTKTQAIAVLEQAKKSQDINLFAPVDPNHAFYKLSCDELEQKLLKYVEAEGMAGVVEEVAHKASAPV
jgi:hypothetical protein